MRTILVFITNSMEAKPQPQPAASPSAPNTPPRVASGQILQGYSAVEIDHAGQRYWLRVTRENKLILTK